MATDGIKIDTREWERALLAYMRTEKRTLAEVLNKKAYFILRGALALTPAATAKDISSDLGTAQNPKALAFKIVNKRAANMPKIPRESVNEGRRRQWLSARTREDVAAAVRQMIGARRRSVGYLKSGWVDALRIIGRAAREYERAKAKRMRNIYVRSEATPAKDGWSPFVEFIYKVGAKLAGGVTDIHPGVERALGQAWRDEIASMRQKTAERLQRDADKVNAR